MTQEEFYNKVKKEINNLKNRIELDTYIEEKNNINIELENNKIEIIKLKKENQNSNIIELINNKNKLLEVNTIITRLENIDNLSNEEEVELERAKEDKEELNKWYVNSVNEKNDKNRKLLSLLNREQELNKELLQIDNTFHKFHKKNPSLENPINTDEIMEEIDKMEALYNTPDFKEEEYNELKNKYKEEQRLVESIILSLEDFLKQSKTVLDENDDIVNKRDYEIWNKTYEKALTLRKEHTFVDEKEDVVEEDNNVEIVDIEEDNENNEIDNNELNNNELDDEDYSNAEIIFHLSDNYNNVEETDYLNDDIDLVDLALAHFNDNKKEDTEEKNDLLESVEEIEENDNIDLNDYYVPEKEEIVVSKDDIDLKSYLVDFTNDQLIINKIKDVESVVSKVIEEAKTEDVDHYDAIDKLESIRNDIDIDFEVNTLDKYNEFSSIITDIIHNSDKSTELIQISLGKIDNLDELKSLSLNELSIISKLDKDDYKSLIILLVNNRQYNNGIDDIKKNYDTIEEDNNISK